MEQYAPASYNLPINWQPFPGDNARANCSHQKEQQIEPAKRLACFHSRRGIDPYAYLRDVLSRLPNMTNRQVPEVTPAAWAKARTELIPLKAAS